MLQPGIFLHLGSGTRDRPYRSGWTGGDSLRHAGRGRNLYGGTTVSTYAPRGAAAAITPSDDFVDPTLPPARRKFNNRGKAIVAWESSRMEVYWSALAVVGALAGVFIMVFGFRRKEKGPVVIDKIDGVLKQDWMRTGNIDFHASEASGDAPQFLILRLEERKVIETAMGQDVVQLRWRLATVEEAKEVVVCWNRAKATADEARRDGTPTP
jgi:hypothetical protein